MWTIRTVSYTHLLEVCFRFCYQIQRVRYVQEKGTEKWMQPEFLLKVTYDENIATLSTINIWNAEKM